jgi:hypothetical protein
VFREDVAEICAVEDVFEGWKDADPYRRSICAINESVEGQPMSLIVSQLVPEEAAAQACIATRFMTYLQEYHRTNHAIMGRNGRKNWRVMGRMSEIMRPVAMSVFSIGPGSCIMLRQKMPRTANPKY